MDGEYQGKKNMLKSRLKIIEELLEKIGKQSLSIIGKKNEDEDIAILINKTAHQCHTEIQEIYKDDSYEKL